MPRGRRPWSRPQGLAWLISLLLHVGIFSALLLWATLDQSRHKPTSPGIDTVIADLTDDDTFIVLAPPSPPVVAPVVPPPAPAEPVHPPEQLAPTSVGQADPVKSFAQIGDKATWTAETRNTKPAPVAPAPVARTGPALPPLRSGQTIIYLLDRSASMEEEGHFDAARRWVIEQLGQLPPDVYFQVIAYNRAPLACPLGVGAGLTATPENVRLVSAWLAGLRTEGGSNHLGALREALLRSANTICLLTDGDDLDEAWVREVTRLNRGRAIVHAIGFPASGGAVLAELAQWNRGTYCVLGGQ